MMRKKRARLRGFCELLLTGANTIRGRRELQGSSGRLDQFHGTWLRERQREHLSVSVGFCDI